MRITDALKDSGRKEYADCTITSDQRGTHFEMLLLRRVSAKGLTFEGLSFRYTILDGCYFRNCRFIDCDFTGASFIDTNLRGSTFDGSHFDYARFTRTIVGHSVLERHLPGYENVQLELARALRVNFGQLGDTEGVNKAILAELAATRVHLRKAAWSKESYYRKKYQGLQRATMMLKHAAFVTLDFAWGNGESLWRVARSVMIIVVLFVVYLASYSIPLSDAVRGALGLFFGTDVGDIAPPQIVWVAAVLSRYVLLGGFMTVLVKRLARR